MMQEIIGIIGVALIALSWIPQAVQTVRTKKSGITLGFGVSQFVGSFFIILYSFMIKEPLFVILNVMAVILIGINLKYNLKEKRR